LRPSNDTERTNSLLTLSLGFADDISSDLGLGRALASLARRIEDALDARLASVLLLDGETLHCAAAPSLPLDYIEGLGALKIGPKVGACGSAAYLKRQIVSTSIQNDERWAMYWDLAKQHGLVSCSSTPILGRKNEVLGTFAIYSRVEAAPTPYEEEIIRLAVKFAQTIIERFKTERQFFRTKHRYDQTLDLVSNAVIELDCSAAVSEVKSLQRGAGLPFGRGLQVADHVQTQIAKKMVVKDVNQAAVELYQATSKTQLCDHLAELFSIDPILPAFWDGLMALVEGENFAYHQTALQTVRGEHRIVQCRLLSIGGEGDYSSVLISQTDVTEEVKSSLRAEKVVEASHDLIFEYDPYCDTLSWNRTLYQKLTLPQTLADFLELVEQNDREELAFAFKAHSLKPRQPSRLSFRIVDPVSEVEMHFSGYLTEYDPFGIEKHFIIGSLVDRSTEMQLREKLDQKRRFEAVGKLAGHLAHDFNNHLSVIIGGAESLIEDDLSEVEVKKRAAGILRSAGHGSRLIKEMLAFSRQQSLTPKVTCISSLLDRIHPLLKKSLKPTVSISIENLAEGALIDVDPDQLENSILNLVINANDAMPEGGEIKIIVSPGGQISQVPSEQADVVNSGERSMDPEASVVIAVRDSGTGMTDAVKRRAFDPFFTTKSLTNGTGLGLSAVRGFVEQSNGQVSINSQLGSGTEVLLSFPATNSKDYQSIPEDCSAPTSCREDVASQSILVVDDNQLVADHVASYFRGNGHIVDICSSGEEGFSLLKSFEYDLLVSDIVMPGALDGIALAQASQRLHPAMPVILMTGYSDYKDERLQEFTVLQKPFSRRALSAAASQSLKGLKDAAP
jgi:signal transduction histidine kinase/PAS domain-containing protein